MLEKKFAEKSSPLRTVVFRMSRRIVQLLLSVTALSIFYICTTGRLSNFEPKSDKTSLGIEVFTNSELRTAHDSDYLSNLYYFPVETLNEHLRTTCYSLPNANDIAYNNVYWQVLETPTTKLYLFSAHYDDRPALEKPVVHILAEVTKKLNKNELRCFIWYGPNENAVVTAIDSVIYLSSDLKRKVSFKRIASESLIITCKLPVHKTNKIPYAVGLTNKSVCTTNNNNALKVHKRSNETRRKFAVCMKGLQFPNDLSTQLVEWIELNHLFGAEFFSFYVYTAHPNVEKVLKYYSSQGIAEVLRLTLPGVLPNIHPVRQKFYEGVGDAWPHEYIPMNDCYMRNMKNTDYIAVLDIDELMVPLGTDGWSEMIGKLDHKNASTFSFADLYFWDEMKQCEPGVPCYFHFMQRIVRAKQHYENKTISHHYKSMHDTRQVLTVTHHFERICFEICKRYYIPKEEAQLQHYRKSCIFDITENECYRNFKKESFVQKSLWKYASKLVPSVEQVLQLLQIRPKSQ